MDVDDDADGRCPGAVDPQFPEEGTAGDRRPGRDEQVEAVPHRAWRDRAGPPIGHRGPGQRPPDRSERADEAAGAAATNGDTDAAINEIRYVLQAVVVASANGQVQTAEQLSARVRAMVGDLQEHCAHREMGAALPGLIADLHASIDAGHDDARLLRLAVPLHVLGTQTYLKITRAPDDLRLVAASLANNAAQRLRACW